MLILTWNSSTEFIPYFTELADECCMAYPVHATTYHELNHIQIQCPASELLHFVVYLPFVLTHLQVVSISFHSWSGRACIFPEYLL